MIKDITPEELKALLDKGEARRRRQAKRRNEEILILMTEQQTEMRLDYEGKLWGEKSITEIAETAYGGDGEKWSTDTEARLCADIDPRAYGIEPDISAQPLKQVLLIEAWDLATKVIGSQWGQSGLKLFGEWLTMPVVELCQEADVPAMQTLDLIKAMVKALRSRVFNNGRANIFPFLEEETEIRASYKKINQARGMRRNLENTSQPAAPKLRVYLTPEELEQPLDAFHAYLASKGYQMARGQAWRVKQRGWVHKPGFKPGGDKQGLRIELTEEEKQLHPKSLAEKFGIAVVTARVTKKRGFFIINSQNQLRVRILNLSDPAVVVATKERLAKEDKKHCEKDGEVFTSCGLCGWELKLSEAVLEHVVSKHKGGHDLFENLCLLHPACQSQPGERKSPIPAGDYQRLEAVELPGVIKEIAGKKISELTAREMVVELGFSPRYVDEIHRKGYLSPRHYSLIRQADLKNRIGRIERRGWDPEEFRLPGKVSEVAGRKIKDLRPIEIRKVLGISKRSSSVIRGRGFFLTKTWSEKKKAEFRKILRRLEKEGWPTP